MSEVKMLVRIVVSLMLFYGVVSGQVLSRRQQLQLQRQQKQVDQQQEMLEKQLLSQTITSASAADQSFPPINHAILDSIFNVPIQAIRAVNELVRALATARARLNGPQTVNPTGGKLTDDQISI